MPGGLCLICALVVSLCAHAHHQAARELNMDVVPEGGMMFYWNLNQIMDGHTTIEHSLPMSPLYKDVVRGPPPPTRTRMHEHTQHSTCFRWPSILA
jgi:hypothetical protein